MYIKHKTYGKEIWYSLRAVKGGQRSNCILLMHSGFLHLLRSKIPSVVQRRSLTPVNKPSYTVQRLIKIIKTSEQHVMSDQVNLNNDRFLYESIEDYFSLLIMGDLSYRTGLQNNKQMDGFLARGINCVFATRKGCSIQYNTRITSK